MGKFNIKYGVVAALTMATFVAPSVGAIDWGATSVTTNTNEYGETEVIKTADVTLEATGTTLVIADRDYNGESIADVLYSASIKDGTGTYALKDKVSGYDKADLTFTWDGVEVDGSNDTDPATAGDHKVTVSDGITTTTEITVKIAKKTIATSATVTADADGKGKAIAYTGAAVTPVFYLGGVKLGASDIVSVSYKDSKDENVLPVNLKKAGTYKVTLKVKESDNIELDGNTDDATAQLEYAGTFTIAPADLAKKTATLDYTTHAYTGEELEPGVTIAGLTAYDKRETEPAHTEYDFKVSYSNNINVGTATVTVTGNGNYTGTITKTFSVTKAVVSTTTATVPDASAIYRGSAVIPKCVTIGTTTFCGGFTMSFTDSSLDRVNVTGTEIPFTVTADGSNIATTSAGISGKFTIAPLALDTGTVRTKAADLEGEGVEILVVNPAYTGSEVLPTVKVYVEGTEVPASEYKIVSKTAATAKSAAGIVTLQKSDAAKAANVTGTKDLDFTVDDTASIASATISGIAASYTYNGDTKEPAVTVTMNGATLIEGTDYVINYKGNLKVGTATVTIKGTGSYTGSISKTFKINPAKAKFTKATVGAKKVTVKASKGKGAAGIQIAYRVKGTSKWTYKKTTKSSYTIKSLKKGKKYTISIRSYKKVGDTTYYSGWTTKTTKKVK